MARGVPQHAPQEALERAARLARRLLGAPVALVTLLAAERQVLDRDPELPPSLAGLLDSPLWRALAGEVAAGEAPLVVADVSGHPLVRHDPAVPLLDAAAYLGVPLPGPDGEVLGALAVIDSTTRRWTEQDIAALADLSRTASGELAAEVDRSGREQAEAALRAGEARTSEILERIDAAFYAIDRQWRFLCVNGEAERLWGRRRDELLGRRMFEVFPTFRGSPSHRAHERALAEGRPVHLETMSTVTGLPFEIHVFPGPSGLSVYFRDVSARRRMEQALRERDETLTLAERSAEIGIWDVDLATGMVRATPQFFRILGLEPVAGPVPLETFRAVRHPEDRERVVRGFQEVLERGEDAYEMEYRIIRADGEVRWIFGRGRVVRDDQGRPVRYSGVDLDVTERRRLEEHQKLLLSELSHRVKNTLATVQSIARQSLEDGRPAAEGRDAFLSRLQALAETHDLLTRSEWRGAGLRALVEGQLRPYGESVGVTGPDLVLSPRAGLTLGLIIHELATNAAKHGALSAPAGRVDVAWQIDEGGSFRLTWRERGGPPVSAPSRRGFGRTLLERAASYDLLGAATFEPAPDGLRYELTAPVAEMTA